ncbi:MAG TPA: aldo/keto reductase [Anaeromyxobacter sp.]|nr:aldo/keto reductase [Anaeromyxobacter sp.]
MLERRHIAGRLGLGTAALGRPAYIAVQHAADFRDRTPEAMERQAHAVLDAAFRHGIRYVDVARSYGLAERFVRSWIDARGLSPVDVAVGSKWGYVYVGDWRVDAPVHERKEHSLAMLERQARESTSILREHLRLYQIHSATLESGVLEDDAILDALARLKERPLVIGLTTSGPRQAETLRRAMAITRGGAPLFGAVQATWNVLERSCEEALQEASQAGMIVFLKEVLANGRLTSRGDAREGSALARIAASRGVTPDAVAIAAALSRPWADVVLVGPSTVEHLASNLAARQVQLTAGDLAALEALREPPARYWDTRARLPWN